jgi:hypothetical protein
MMATAIDEKWDDLSEICRNLSLNPSPTTRIYEIYNGIVLSN